MVITPHAVLGAGLAKKLKKFPVLGLALAFTSHFLLDMIPHSEYSVKTIFAFRGPVSLLSLIYLSLDISLAFFLIRKFVSKDKKDMFLVFSGAFFGILPDIFTAILSFIKIKILGIVQGFHVFIHSKISPEFFTGWILQVVVVIVVFILIKKQKEEEIC